MSELPAAAKPIAEGAFIACLFVGVFLAAFHVPQPHEVPIAISGPPAQVRTVSAELERVLPGALDPRAATDPAAARRAIEDREAYGAIVLDTDRAAVLYAGANGPVATTFFRTRLPAGLARSGIRAAARDVVPLPARDVSGLSLFYLTFGTVMGSFLFSVVAFTTTERRLSARAHVVTVAAFALVVAIAEPALAGIIGAVAPEHLPVVGLVVGLLAFGTSLASVLLLKISRPLGTLVPSALLLTLGNATGGTVPPPFLPDWLGWLSPLLPGGTALSGLRGAVSFDGAGLTAALLVLAAWAVLPFALLAVTSRWVRAPVPA